MRGERLLLALAILSAGCNLILGNGDHVLGSDGGDGAVGEQGDEGGDENAILSDDGGADVNPRGTDAGRDATVTDGAAPDAPGGGDATPIDATVDSAPVDATVDAAPGDATSDTAGDGSGALCASGQLECDGGCVANDVQHCGSCSNDCTNLPFVSGTVSCSAGQCSFPPSSCSPGRGDCNGTASDGCETDLTQAAHCGGCSTACTGATPVCAATDAGEGCASGCPASTPMLCGGTCVDTTTSVGNCGTCSKACTTTVAHAQPACVGSGCSFTCNTGYTQCSGACVDEQSDVNNCGACGKTCAPGQACSGGGCTCTATSCTAGCCSGATCVLYASQNSAQCGSGKTCGPCGTGLDCNANTAGQCVCDSTSCASGCCSNSTTCELYASQSNGSCGTGGATCGSCGSGISCNTSGGLCLGCGAGVSLASSGTSDQFGTSVAISGGTLLVGSPTAANTVGGAAFWYTGSGTTWTAQGALTPSLSAAGAGFGSWVAISGTTAAVGGSPNGTPAIAIFTQNGSAWIQATTLMPANTGGLGPVFALDGNTLVVGGWTGATVYTGSGATWTQQGPVLQPSDYTPDSSDPFGTKVAISGNEILVGGSPSASGSGAFFLFGYVFVRSGTTWTQQAKLSPINMTANSSPNLRWSVAIDGPNAAIAYNLGGYAFQQNGTTWAQTSTLANAGDNDFGSSIAISGSGMIVGSENTVGSNGNAYWFGLSSGGNWIAWPTALVSNGTVPPDGFAHSVALSGSTAFVGAFDANSVFVYPCSP